MSASLKLGDIVFHLSEDVDSLIIPVPSSRTSADIVSQPGGTIVPGADGMLAVSECASREEDDAGSVLHFQVRVLMPSFGRSY